jgi:hypothetical protein
MRRNRGPRYLCAMIGPLANASAPTGAESCAGDDVEPQTSGPLTVINEDELAAGNAAET